MDQWLIRTSSNMIAGPYLREQLKDMIRSGKLSLADEICSGTGYWIFLHEQQELKKLLEVEFSETYSNPKEKAQAVTPKINEESFKAEDITETTSILRTDRSQGKPPTPKKLKQYEGYALWRILFSTLIWLAILFGVAIYKLLNP